MYLDSDKNELELSLERATVTFVTGREPKFRLYYPYRTMPLASTQTALVPEWQDLCACSLLLTQLLRDPKITVIYHTFAF